MECNLGAVCRVGEPKEEKLKNNNTQKCLAGIIIMRLKELRRTESADEGKKIN